jgi:hypothetical protein
MEVELPKSAYVKDLKRVVAQRMNVDPSTVTGSFSSWLIIACLRRTLFKEVLQTSH